MSIRTSILGYPRVGANRELKKAEEAGGTAVMPLWGDRLA